MTDEIQARSSETKILQNCGRFFGNRNDPVFTFAVEIAGGCRTSIQSHHLIYESGSRNGIDERADGVGNWRTIQTVDQVMTLD